MIRAVNWDSDKVEALRRSIAIAERLHLPLYMRGVPVSIDHARHVLACLDEVNANQTDKVSERENDHVRTV